MIKVLCGLVASLFGYTARAQCPDASKHETIQDCPWAEITRATEGIDDLTQLRMILNKKAPGFLLQIEKDAKAPDLLQLWGSSNNFNAGQPKDKIIPTHLLKLFSAILPVNYNNEYTVGHAGLNHTYGYLFSPLYTPYGFKRARFVQGEIEAGFGLPSELFSGQPPRGTLFTNFTHFLASIAFRDQPSSKNELKEIVNSGKFSVLPEINSYPYQDLKPKRLLEIVETKNYHLEIRTDVVPFNHANPKGTNQSLLIYSIDLHAIGKPSRPLLITAFPVLNSFGTEIFSPSELGEKKNIKLKYNANIPVTIPEVEMVGKRVIYNESASNHRSGH